MLRASPFLLLALYLLSTSTSQPTCSEEEKKTAEAEVQKCVEDKSKNFNTKFESVEDVFKGLKDLICNLMAEIKECLKPMSRCLTEKEFKELFDATIANATGGHNAPGPNVTPQC